MQQSNQTSRPACGALNPGVGRVRRILLAFAGVVCVALAAIGVVLPGMPTTIFLILATACFMRSCPWMQRVLVENRLFGPFLKYLEPGTPMPLRAKVASMILMWVAIAVSIGLLATRDLPIVWIGASIVLAGLIGTISIARVGNTTPAAFPASA
jgi:uncharacterized membrane protein YbaN (DUF454 family)